MVYMASAPDFTDQPLVGNGASEVLVEIFGDAGRHARSAVGVAALPINAPVEVELVVAVGSTPTIHATLTDLMPSHSYDVLARLAPRVPAAMVELAARWPPDPCRVVPLPAASVDLAARQRELGSRLTCCTATRAWPSHPPWWFSRAVGSTRPSPMVAIRSVAARSVRQPRRPALYWPRLIFIRGRTGSLRRSSRAAMTPGSSWQLMPADQEAADISGETERAEWSTPGRRWLPSAPAESG